MSNNNEQPYTYNQCYVSSSSSYLNENGERVSRSWRGGYGMERKNGQTKYFALPSNSDGYVTVDENEYKNARDRVDRYFGITPSIQNNNHLQENPHSVLPMQNVELRRPQTLEPWDIHPLHDPFTTAHYLRQENER